MKPSLSFLIPTAGRLELEVCLASLSTQISDVDEVLIIGDTTDNLLLESENIVSSFGEKFKYLTYTSGVHTWGHDQINYGITQAKGNYLHFCDDDDVYLKGAVEVIRDVAADSHGKVSLVKFWSYHGHLIWTEKGRFQQDYVGGHCIVCPNVPEKLGTWLDHYQGDWSFMEETVRLNGGLSEIIWRDEIVCYARPDKNMQTAMLMSAGRDHSPLLSV